MNNVYIYAVVVIKFRGVKKQILANISFSSFFVCTCWGKSILARGGGCKFEVSLSPEHSLHSQSRSLTVYLPFTVDINLRCHPTRSAKNI